MSTTLGVNSENCAGDDKIHPNAMLNAGPSLPNATMTSPMLAASCGPAVATWDYTTTSQSSAVLEIDPTVVGRCGPDDLVDICHPHGPSSTVSALTWNHNSQVLATCSSSSSIQDEPNVSLTHAATGTTLETLSNFLPTTNADCRPAAATALGFGGKSRYLVVSDASGCASVWDLKKTARVRSFRLPQPPPGSGISSNHGGLPAHVRGCTAARIDPTDTFVAAASGWETDGALRLYRLREGKLAATLRDIGTSTDGGEDEWEGHGGISVGALDFSPLDSSRVAVGTRDGSVLLWDVQSATSSGPGAGVLKSVAAVASPSRVKASVLPMARLTQRHDDAVTGVAYSPVNRVLLSSCSSDGSVSFHDVNMPRTIQSFRPGSETHAHGVAKSSAVMCVSFASDGVTCAVGTKDGHLYLYDLRKAGSGPLSRMDFVPKGNNASSFPVLNAKFTSHAMTNGHTVRVEREATVTAATAVSERWSVQNTITAKDAGRDSSPTTPAKVAVSNTTAKFLSFSEGKIAADVSEPIAISSRKQLASKTNSDSNIPFEAIAERKVASTNGDAEPAKRRDFLSNSDVSESIDSSSRKLLASKTNDSSNISDNITAEREVVVTDHAPEPAKGQEEKEIEENLPDDAAQASEAAARAEESLASTLQAMASLSSSSAPPAHTADTSFLVQTSKGGDGGSSGPDLVVNKLVLKRMVQDEIDDLREDMEGAMRNMHIDMLRQFQEQSNELQSLFAKQRETMECLVEQNRQLREENERLRLPTY